MNDDRPLPLINGSVLDLRKRWPLPPATTQEALERAAEKAAPRRFTGEPPSAFASLDSL